MAHAKIIKNAHRNHEGDDYQDQDVDDPICSMSPSSITNDWRYVDLKYILRHDLRHDVFCH